MSKNYISELINENLQVAKMENATSVEVEQKISYAKYKIKKENYEIKSATQQQKYGLNKGNYTIVTYENQNVNSEQDMYFISYLSRVIKEYVRSYQNILVVGLGNRHISADSLGAKVLHYVIPTRYCHHLNFLKNTPNLSAISTSVYALTGIDSFDIIKSVVDRIKIDCVVVIDSLCATNYKRLGTSFQIHNAGVMPGQGVGNKRKILGKATLGVEVVTIGVPLVMYASTLNEELIDDLIVTLKDIDEVSTRLAKYLGIAITKAVTSLSLAEIQNFLSYR